MTSTLYLGWAMVDHTTRSLAHEMAMLQTEVLAVVDQTMQPTTASLWLRPSAKPR